MLIGARNGMLVKGGYTARDYPAMPDLGFWDGIENIGFGRHETNPNQWCDLSGNERHFSNLYCIDGFSADSALFKNRTGSAQSWTINPDSIKTIEVCGKSARDKSYVAFEFSDATRVSCQRLFAILPTQNRGFNFSSDKPSMYKDWWSNRWSVACTFASEANPIQYYNSTVGTLNSGTSTWADGGVSLGYAYSSSLYSYEGEICSCRLHSRVLTADEIAANYAVDKARFNLP